MNWGGKMVVATTVAFGLTGVALGFGHERGHHGTMGRRPDGTDRILERVVHPCHAGCFDESRTCTEAATSTASTCVANSCGGDVTAAQAACKSGKTSTCQNAMGALRTCAQTCTDTAATSQQSCRTTMASCLGRCGQAS